MYTGSLLKARKAIEMDRCYVYNQSSQLMEFSPINPLQVNSKYYITPVNLYTPTPKLLIGWPDPPKN